MRKLSPTEQHALNVLVKHGSYCPGTDSGGLVMVSVRKALDGLVRKGRATVEATDDGARYSPTEQGHADAQ